MSTIVVMLLATAMFLVPLLWQLRSDARLARADVIAADIRAALSHRFHGETYLSVHVTPRSFRHAGRVVISAPAGYEWLIQEAWQDTMSRTPAGYELVLQAGDGTATNAPRETEARRLPRAA
jgi:hypothetical protein